MASKRVHQFAKELGIGSKEMLDLLHSMGEDIQNVLSSVSEDVQEAVRRKLAAPGVEKAKREQAAKKTASVEASEKAAVSAKKARTEKAAMPASNAAKPGAGTARMADKTQGAEADKGETARGPAPAKKRKPAPRRVEAPTGARQEERQASAERAATEAATTAAKESREAAAGSDKAASSQGGEAKQRAAREPQAERPRVPLKQSRGRRGARREARPAPGRQAEPHPPREASTKPMKKKLRIPSGITVREFAQKVGRRPSEIISRLMSLGETITINQSISDDALLLLGEDLGIDLEVKSRALEVLEVAEDSEESLRPRPPVVTVMGHVDHGKTSLLDAIRNTAITDGEMGGITQHIGASVVEAGGKTITFIDTPGHESFTAMRARGAQVTDIAVLVVAADDGVMPQTIEAIDHARAAGVPIIVAVNKIDKPDANPTRVRQQLTEFNLLPEEWGGDTIYVDVSAREKTNLDQLLEMILLLAEINDYRANPDARASGNIVEARLDRGRGPVATLLVKRGTLRRGDALVAGRAFGRVRALFDDRGRPINEAGPSSPVEVLGLNVVPEAGDEFGVVEDEKKARALVEARISREKAEGDRVAVRTFTLEDLFQRIQEGEAEEFNLIVKGDTQGSVEAVRDSLAKIKVGDIVVNVIHSGVGAITENDVMLARASGAVVIGFNVRPDLKAQELAAREKVEIKTYRVIYQLLEDVEAALVGMLKPEYEEVQVGLLEVREVFRVPRLGTIAGAYVKEGEINRNSRVRVVRDGAIIYEGSVASLRRFKDDVRSVAAGYECGLGLENFQDIKQGDLIEVVEMREVPRGAEAPDS